jgi:tetratricopeptide (TPR) repeat protein
MATFDQRRQVVDEQYNVAGNMYIYAQATPRPVDPETLAAAERQLAVLPLEMIPDPAPLPPGSRMPLRRNPLFVGREADLRALATVLKGGKTMAIAQTAAIVGLGGMGKTQLASEFSHRYGQFFAGGVFWLSFSELAAVPAEVAACGRPGVMALHQEFHTLPIADQVQLVQAAWQSPLPRLLIFDNCEDEALLAQWRPPHGGCRVLVTSRRASWEPSLGVQLVPLGILQRDESLALLRHHRPDLATDDADLNAIAAELGDLPLALHLAGSFLARYRHAITPAAYLAQLQQPELLTHRSLQGGTLTRELSPTGHEPHVARTFALSYDRLDPADPIDASALALLARAAHFSPGQPILRDLLLATITGAEEASDAALQAEDALRRLQDFGLLESDAMGAIRLHRLLAVFVRAVIHDAAAQTAVEDALLAEANHLLSAGYPGPLLVLYPHLQAMVEATPSREEAQTARLEAALGSALYVLGDYAGAQPAIERARALSERVLGADHPATAASLNNLALLYNTQGRYAEAEPLYQRALALRERALGPDHQDTATSLNNLAALYWAQGRYGAAEPLFQRALALCERALGPDHPDTAQSLNNLAALYRAQGRYAEAEPLYQRALALRERALGPDHPDTAQSLNNLAALYRAQGRYAEAELLYQRALAIHERVLGADHPNTATSLDNLAGLYRAQGRYEAAEPLYQRALAIMERALGPDHPNVATSLNNLAGLYRAQRRYAEAEPLYQRALAITERVLGPDHPDTATSLNNLAALYQVQGRYGAAEPLFQRALAIMERALGPDHPDTAQSLNNLAVLYRAQGRYAEAEPLYQHALALRERVLGPDHPDTATSLNNLAALYRAQGRYGAAEPLFQRALALRERALGPDHPDTAQSLNNLAALYRAHGRYAAAALLYQRALAIREQVLGPEHPDTAASLSTLATLYHVQERYAEAEPLYQRALTIQEQRLGRDHPDVVVTLKNYLVLLKAMHRETDAAQLEQRLLAMQEGSPMGPPSTP